VPSAAVLLYFMLKISIAKAPFVIEYMEHLGISFAPNIDPLFVATSLVVGALGVIAAFNGLLEAAGVVEKLNKKIEKPVQKDPEDEKMGPEYTLPLYHSAGMTGYGSAANEASESGGGKYVFSGPIGEESDRSMAWWAANMHKRFYDRGQTLLELGAQWNYVDGLSLPLPHSTPPPPDSNLTKALASSVVTQDKPIIRSYKERNTNMSTSTFVSRFIGWLWIAALSTYIHTKILDLDTSNDDTTEYIFAGTLFILAIRSFGGWVVDLAGPLTTTCYRKLRKVMTATATEYRRISRENEEQQKIINKTTPLISTADDAVFRITPGAASFATFIASLPILLLSVYTVGYLDNKQLLRTFLNEHRAIHICLLACWSCYGMLTSPGFKYDIDRIYHKIKVEKGRAVHASTTTDAAMQTPTAASQCCASCKGTGKVNSSERHGELQGSEVDTDFDGDNFDVLDDPLI
ncbi:MAG: hypothetical protein Q9192_003744, partial [Flavoplaca navasiana]